MFIQKNIRQEGKGERKGIFFVVLVFLIITIMIVALVSIGIEAVIKTSSRIR